MGVHHVLLCSPTVQNSAGMTHLGTTATAYSPIVFRIGPQKFRCRSVSPCEARFRAAGTDLCRAVATKGEDREYKSLRRVRLLPHECRWSSMNRQHLRGFRARADLARRLLYWCAWSARRPTETRQLNFSGEDDMNKFRNLGTALALAGFVATGMMASSARLQAAGPGSGGGRSNTVICGGLKLLYDAAVAAGLDERAEQIKGYASNCDVSTW